MVKRGIFNDYRSDALRKRIGKDIVELTKNFAFPRSTEAEPRHIVCYPGFPKKRTSVYRIASHLRLRVTNQFVPHPLIAISWDDATFRSENTRLREYANHHGIPLINAASTDISKRFVDDCMTKTFGYSAVVDPSTHDGPFVQKGNINAAHDGLVLEQPLNTAAVREDSVYQILIDNRVKGGLVEDLRVPVFGSIIPCIIVKRRKVEERFKNKAEEVEVVAPGQVFSEKELQLLQSFCRNAGLEHGELDVLRDQRDSRIYVVDVNNTPCSPPRTAPKEVKETILKLNSAAFIKAFGLDRHAFLARECASGEGDSGNL